jgi:hypothetical protein
MLILPLCAVRTGTARRAHQRYAPLTVLLCALRHVRRERHDRARFPALAALGAAERFSLSNDGRRGGLKRRCGYRRRVIPTLRRRRGRPSSTRLPTPHPCAADHANYVQILTLFSDSPSTLCAFGVHMMALAVRQCLGSSTAAGRQVSFTIHLIKTTVTSSS